MFGAQPVAASIDHVFTDAFQGTSAANASAAADGIGVFGLHDGLPGFEDVAPVNLGFIGQSFFDQIEPGGHWPSGLLHGLV